LKDLGFQYATKAGITFSASDVISPTIKDEIIAKTEKEINKIIKSYMNGEITETERYNRVIDKWKMTTEEVTDILMKELEADRDGFNPINMMYSSSARGGKDQIKQLGAMRGLMDKPSKGTSESIAEVIETPIKSNFKEGLTVLEYFISTHGARKGLADTALKTADAGYLTRRLVDVAQNAVITSEDCGTIEGIEVTALKEGRETIEPLSDRIKGRTAAEDILDPVTEEIICHANEEITNEKAIIIQKHGINSVKVRSPLTCESEKGICAKCYGRNLGTNKPVTIGEPVGVIAAQSIGEPGTQLTLRTFHIGGTASTDVDLAQPQFKIITEEGKDVLVPLPKGLNIEVEDGVYVYPGDILGKTSRITVKQSDITGGLPRVQDLFEAREPKNKAIISEIAGTVSIGNLTNKGREIFVKAEDGTEQRYIIPPGKRIIVHEGDIVDSGDALSGGPLDPHDILKAKGIKAAQTLILNEIQEVYQKQGVKIDDKHIAVIIRQMFKKIRIINPGHTMFLEGEIVDRNQVMKENKRIEEKGGEGATFEQLLLGITKASLLTDSWLSAASFQETTKVLTQASIEGKVDNLEGLKESIIIGHRIPVGTGTKYFNSMVEKAKDEGKTVGDIISELAHAQKEEEDENLLDF
ncbi:MAG: hypothetical protein B6D62_03920, partial [Candidatus Cloacimonas sp. 4484_275]